MNSRQDGPLIVGIVGSQGAGKTAVAVELVSRLRQAGLAVGYVKHAHRGFDADRPESDTERVKRAGALAVAAAGPGSWFLLADGDPTPTSLAGRMRGTDLVIAEGWHDAPWPKVAVRLEGGPDRPAAGPILATLGTRRRPPANDGDPEGSGTTLDLPTDRLDALAADLVAQVAARQPAVELTVDGRPVAVSGFAADIIASTVRGLLSALRDGVGQDIRLVIRDPSSNGPASHPRP